MAKNNNINSNIMGVLNELKETPSNMNDINIKEEVTIKEEKKKNRSFMLPESTIKKLKELNFILDKDLSSIVTDAIEVYYEQNKEVIEKTLK